MKNKPVLVIACGALAREIESTIKTNDLGPFEMNYLSAGWHNQPDKIPGEVQRVIREARLSGKYAKMVVVYGDCGTRGELDKVLKEEDVQRIQGARCVDIYLASGETGGIVHDESGDFCVTDYLVKYFEQLCACDSGLDCDSGCLNQYYDRYKRLVYLAQSEDKELQLKAIDIADRLGLEYVYHYTGLGEMEKFLGNFSKPQTMAKNIH